MIIELIGPSGSGKTTLVNRIDNGRLDETPAILSLSDLRRLENEIGWRKARKDKSKAQFGRFVAFSLRYPAIAWPLLVLTLIQGRPYRWRAISRVHATFLLSLHLKNNLHGRVAILDEGFVQSLWAVLIGSKDLRGKWLLRRLVVNYQRIINPINIVLDAEPATARSRVFARTSRGRFNKTSSDAQKQQFDDALGHHRRIVALMSPDLISASLTCSKSETEISQRLLRLINRFAAECGPNRSASDDLALALKSARQ